MQALIETNETIIFTFYAIRKSRIKMLCSVAVVKSIVTEKNTDRETNKMQQKTNARQNLRLIRITFYNSRVMTCIALFMLCV